MADAMIALDPHAKKREEVISHLRNAIEQAERGEVIGLCMVLLDANGTSTHHSVTEWDQARLAGALVFLLHRISATGWDDDG